MIVPPNFARPGVIGGFAMSLPVSGLAIDIDRGALFAQGTLYRPGGPQTLPNAPANQWSVLGYNSGTGWYWTNSWAPVTAGDALLGWALADATDVIAVSNQSVAVGAVSTGSSSGAGGTALPGSGGATYGSLGQLRAETMTVTAGACAPDPTLGEWHVLNVTAATVVNGPSSPATGFFAIEIVQDGTGRAITFDGAAYESPNLMAARCRVANSITHFLLRGPVGGKYRVAFSDSYIPA